MNRASSVDQKWPLFVLLSLLSNAIVRFDSICSDQPSELGNVVVSSPRGCVLLLSRRARPTAANRMLRTHGYPDSSAHSQSMLSSEPECVWLFRCLFAADTACEKCPDLHRVPVELCRWLTYPTSQPRNCSRACPLFH